MSLSPVIVNTTLLIAAHQDKYYRKHTQARPNTRSNAGRHYWSRQDFSACQLYTIYKLPPFTLGGDFLKTFQKLFLFTNLLLDYQQVREKILPRY